VNPCGKLPNASPVSGSISSAKISTSLDADASEGDTYWLYAVWNLLDNPDPVLLII
jgi:hypothetical protein